MVGLWDFLGFSYSNSCATTKTLTSSPTYKITQASTQNQQLKPEEWRPITAEEESQIWQYILNSPLGIAALNQLAIEGFISPNCPKRFYVSQKYDSFQTLLQVKCTSPRGISIATPYQEMQIILSRFEDNIENFEVQRIYMSQ
ncbi:MAG: hypothetical protein QNJ65_02640 [Xenococcaceae cyanobacterium MO_234.B1]|nr:hypothetical protein [Xenococcaceae cyanobacterium MO_234.B1]